MEKLQTNISAALTNCFLLPAQPSMATTKATAHAQLEFNCGHNTHPDRDIMRIILAQFNCCGNRR
ncbi:MAG: hypothetical protein WA364_22925 [Candidatus Nitrosopolaris sp.]